MQKEEKIVLMLQFYFIVFVIFLFCIVVLTNISCIKICCKEKNNGNVILCYF